MTSIEESWIKNADQRQDMLEYQQWFDACTDLKDCISNGFIDFYHRIFTKDFYDIIGNPKDKICLEIGFGGGRIVNAASKLFHEAQGVDILNDRCIDKTYKFLKQVDSNNVLLLNRNNIDKFKNDSVDFLYSYIVFQHFQTWHDAEFYLSFAKRVLKPSGAGIIYFGRSGGEDVKIIPKDKFVNRGCSLYVSEKFAEEHMSKMFDVLEVGETTKSPWDNRRSGQFYVKFKHKG